MHDRYYPDRHPDRRFPAYVGLIALSLAALGLLWRPRDSLPWLALALLLVGLALGGALRVGGQLYPRAPTLFRLLEPLYLVRLVRVPDRFNLFLALPVGMLVALGASQLLARLKRRRRLPLTAGLVALLLLEYLTIPVATRPTALSPFYRQVGAGEVLLNLPIDPFKSKAYMFAQTVHEQPILHGHVSRLPPGACSIIGSSRWLRALRVTGEMPPWVDPRQPPARFPARRRSSPSGITQRSGRRRPYCPLAAIPGALTALRGRLPCRLFDSAAGWQGFHIDREIAAWHRAN
jgi:hypothetical protein